MKGTYVLIIFLEDDQKIMVGKLGNIFFKKGYYAYVGSALGNLEARLARHLRKEKKLHWHLDYLLGHAQIFEIIYTESEKRIECSIVRQLLGLESVKGFGCSDCSCESHLFSSKYLDVLEDCANSAFNKLSLDAKQYDVKA